MVKLFFKRQVAASGFEYQPYQGGRVGINRTNKAKSETKSFLPSFFSKKLVDSKGKAFGRSNERNRGVGTESPPFNRSKKFFVKLFPKKVWAAESRLMKFPVNHNGRPMVAPAKEISKFTFIHKKVIYI
ncbi:MAG: hypothetical protein ACI4JM_06620 [Oscillospiraceae bacterium]